MIFLMDNKGGPLAREFQGYRRALGLDLTTPYFNAGLMAIDRARLAQGGLCERGGGAAARDAASAFPFMEQDALNSLVARRFRAAVPALQFHGRFLPHRPGGARSRRSSCISSTSRNPGTTTQWRGEGRFARAYADWFADLAMARAGGAPARPPSRGASRRRAPLRRRFAAEPRRLSRDCAVRRCLTKRYY